ncbi:MAG: uroporphyrinogen decarboxylase family protein [Defluviitaleaceae bacterium]|nr:uroporphyrinogen decarboxylase family protein [Defluviitaleaceae bacterium]MCL2240396.1 uroporphyrinogen decarboxylase family protein [Defluviitaleaceae bacterium]
MTPKERAIAAFSLQIPDQVPTFELGFTLAPEMFGINLYPSDLNRENIHRLSPRDRERRLHEVAEDIVRVFDALDYCIIPGHFGAGYVEGTFISPERKFLFNRVRERTGGRRMLGYTADGTFPITARNGVQAFAYRMANDPQGLHAEAKARMETAIERNKHLADAGVEVALLCADYCDVRGPFLSPAQFGEFIQPYLAKIIDECKKAGLYTVKHTDGNIMPILEQLVACQPHALHSLDPMAGVDIRQVKARVGHRVALVGNVNCALMQSGTDEELIASAQYCLTHGKPGGGYIFSTCNLPYRGMPPHRYQMALDVWKAMRDYP